jgi:hypothetical protein
VGEEAQGNSYALTISHKVCPSNDCFKIIEFDCYVVTCFISRRVTHNDPGYFMIEIHVKGGLGLAWLPIAFKNPFCGMFSVNVSNRNLTNQSIEEAECLLNFLQSQT